MRGLTSLGPWLLLSAAGLGTVWLGIWSASRSETVAPHLGGGADVAQFRGNASGAASRAGGSGPEGEGEGKSYVAVVTSGSKNGCDEACDVGRLGRKWAALLNFADPAECAGASTSIDFEQGCRAYVEEARAREAGMPRS